jgi:hypothetical protein
LASPISGFRTALESHGSPSGAVLTPPTSIRTLHPISEPWRGSGAIKGRLRKRKIKHVKPKGWAKTCRAHRNQNAKAAMIVGGKRRQRAAEGDIHEEHAQRGVLQAG